MKKNFTAGLALFILAACNNETKTGNTEAVIKPDSSAAAKNNSPAPVADSAAMMKAWQDFAKPGAMHQWMAKFNGSWEGEITEFSNPANPSKSKTTAVYTGILGGLYQEGKMTGSMMGQPFEGRSMMGYDNSKKEFVSTWVDNVGSGIVYMTGQYDSTSKTLNMKGFQTDPYTGKNSDIREVMKITGDNSFTMEMYGTGMDGKEAKFMEGVFSRK